MLLNSIFVELSTIFPNRCDNNENDNHYQYTVNDNHYQKMRDINEKKYSN